MDQTELMENTAANMSSSSSEQEVGVDDGLMDDDYFKNYFS